MIYTPRKKLRTHCQRGHEFTPANTKIIRGEYRNCRKCLAKADKRYRVRAKERDLGTSPLGGISESQAEQLLSDLRKGV